MRFFLPDGILVVLWSSEVPDHVEAMTTNELFSAQDELDLYPDAALTLQMSVQGLPLPDCVTRASRFLEECALMM